MERIFGQALEITELSHLDFTPEQLAQQVREAQPDAVLICSAPIEHRQAIEELGAETIILRPMYEEFRNRRGYVERRLVGYGADRGEERIEPLADGALAERTATNRAPRRPIEKVQEAERRRTTTNGSARDGEDATPTASSMAKPRLQRAARSVWTDRGAAGQPQVGRRRLGSWRPVSSAITQSDGLT